MDTVLASSFEGYGIRFEPLESRHFPGLLQAAGSPETFRHYTRQLDEWTPEGMGRFLTSFAVESGQGYAVVDAASGEELASSSFLDIKPAFRTLEIGATWLREDLRGGWLNPAMKSLMLAKAFDDWRAVRVCLKCDARNARSRAAIQKLGAQFEGVLRNTMPLPDGTLRQTAYYSIVPEEWPSVREGLQRRLESVGQRFSS